MYLLYLFFRIFIYPFLRYLLPLYNKKVAARVEFELRNLEELKPFKKADYGFEISSQGELEQIKPLLNDFLEKGALVELIFCSESVEKECIELKQKYPHTLALLRMPIITFHPGMSKTNPRKWLTCSEFFLCRYDFFPSLIKYGRSCDGFYLLAGTTKNFEIKNRLTQKYLKSCYCSFSKIITSYQGDKKRFCTLFSIPEKNLYTYDFRIERVLSRQSKAQETVATKMKASFELIKNEDRKRFLFGSYWASEFLLFNTLSSVESDCDYFLVPHKLTADELGAIEQSFERLGHRCYVIDESLSTDEIQHIIKSKDGLPCFYIFNFRGILCELYTFFSHVYIGGGFGQSVHSLMEPFLAGSMLYCGDRVERSTEYDFIKADYPESVKIFTETKDVVVEMNKDVLKEENTTALKNIQPSFKHVVEWLKIVK